MQAIIAAARDAAKLCQLVQEKYLVASAKSSGAQTEPVTIADYGSQAIICRALQAHYPRDAVVAEESGRAIPAAGSRRSSGRKSCRC